MLVGVIVFRMLTGSMVGALDSPDEVRNLPQGRELLSLAGFWSIVADKLRYCDDSEFASPFDPA